MSINIKATNIELTSAIEDYVNKMMDNVTKFLNEGDYTIHVEVGKTTNHHKNGEVYKAEFNVLSSGKKFFAEAVGEDLYTTIDEVRDEVVRKMTHSKDRGQTLFKRGASSVKKLLKGIKSYNR